MSWHWCKQMQPVRIADDPTGEQDEQDEQDRSAATADQSPAPKTDHALQPIEQRIEQKESEQRAQAARSIVTIHVNAPLLQSDKSIQQFGNKRMPSR
jgi:hypothetical protein